MRLDRLPVGVSSSVVIEDHNHRILLVQQADVDEGFVWGLPGGGMLSHEDPKYNIPVIDDWFRGNKFPLEVIKPLSKMS